jgi:signal transduction histidine kinase
LDDCKKKSRTRVIKMDEPQATILIVDDEKDVRAFCERALHGYRVFQVSNYDDALQVYERESIDLVLTDVRMPGGSGLDLLKRIKHFDPNAIVIIMTSFSEKGTILKSLREGADDFINKPFNLLQLQNAVEKALNKKKLRGELADLKKLDQLKSNFLSIISHKLRTPITTISLFLQNIDENNSGANEEYFRQNVRMINDEAAYLERLVTDLLAFGRVMVENSELNLVKSNLIAIVDDALQMSHEAQRKPDIETIFLRKPLPDIYLDQLKISFAIQQVIDNAFKFSGETGQVTVSFEQVDDQIHIVVADLGVGISSAELAKVFDKFYQIDPDNTGQVRGFGLGLFYAREFVRQHGGGLDIESELGRGTTVTIMLPMQ